MPLVRHETGAQHVRRAVRIVVAGAALCALCGLPVAAEHPRWFAGEWAWLKYVGAGAVLFALDLAPQGIAEAIAGWNRRRRGR